MDEVTRPEETRKPGQVRARPVLLTMLCLFSFIFFGLISLLCLAGLINSGWITTVMNQYIAKGDFTKGQTILIFVAGFSLHGLAFTGIIFIWNLRKTGYYFLGLSCLIIAAYQLLNPLTAIASTAIYIILILLFSIFFFFMHPRTPSPAMTHGNSPPTGGIRE